MNRDEICFMDAVDLAARIRERELSAREAMAAHLEQIGRVNSHVHAIITQLRDNEALALADAADAKLASGA